MQANNDDCSPFDRWTHQYDQWFDKPPGNVLWQVELSCLRRIIEPVKLPRSEWLEVGVGTGRFASALGIQFGVDPSPEMLRYAAQRGIITQVGRGEQLPYPAGRFDGILLATTLCFLKDVATTLAECHRVLRPGMPLCIGMIPAGGNWGRRYAEKGRQNHPFYRHARFLETTQLLGLAQTASFRFEAACSLQQAAEMPGWSASNTVSAIMPTADFVAVRFRAVKA